MEYIHSCTHMYVCEAIMIVEGEGFIFYVLFYIYLYIFEVCFVFFYICCLWHCGFFCFLCHFRTQ